MPASPEPLSALVGALDEGRRLTHALLDPLDDDPGWDPVPGGTRVEVLATGLRVHPLTRSPT